MKGWLEVNFQIVATLKGCAGFAVLVSALVFSTGASAQRFDPDHPAFADIERQPSLGNQHVSGAVNYETEFPTSGPHSQAPVRPGLYGDAQALERLVHSLEHGNVVIYYDTPGELAMQTLERWTNAYDGAMDGVVAIRRKGLGERVVLTAWQNSLDIERFDVRATYFVDAFRGRGPEGSVR